MVKLDFNKNLNDGALAVYFKYKHSNKFIFCNNSLYYFTGVYWKKDDKKMSILHNYIDDEFYKTVSDEFNKHRQKNRDTDLKINQFNFNTIESLRRLKNRKMFVEEVCIKLTNNDIKWNSHIYLFCFENKLYDLSKNKFVECKADYYINMSTGYKYDDKYDDNLVIELDNLINTILPQEEIKKLYLEILATGLIGQTLEKFIIANGGGRNGKGVLNELHLQMLGNYGYTLPSNVLMNDLKQGSNPEVANCSCKRTTIAREPDKEKKLACSVIKELVGGNTINARLNHSNETETTLHMTLIMECNDKPKLSETTVAMRERIIDVPFKSTFCDNDTYSKLTEEEKKTHFPVNTYYKTEEFKMKYRQALFIILTKHCTNYLNNNKQFVIPDEIHQRKMKYMSASDEIFNYMDEFFKITEDKKDTIKLKEIFDHFKSTEYYQNQTKLEKRNLNYKAFGEQMEKNMFYKKYFKKNKDKVNIMTNIEYYCEE